MLNHAYKIRDILTANKENETVLTTLNELIVRLQNTATATNASFDFLKFVINLLPGYGDTLIKSQVTFEIYDYYYKNMQPKLLKDLIRIKNQSIIYQDYKNQYFSLIHQLTNQLAYLNKIITKNSELISELNYSLSSVYKKYISSSEVLDENRLSIYKYIREEVNIYEIRNLQLCIKFIEINSQIKRQTTLIHAKTNFSVQIAEFIPMSSIVNCIIDFMAKHKTCKLPEFISNNKHNQNELEIIEWLPLLRLSKINKETINLFEAKIQQNLTLFFSLCTSNLNIDVIKDQFDDLQKNSKSFIERTRSIRFKAIQIVQKLFLLKDFMKENNFYNEPEEREIEKKTQQLEPLSINAGRFFTSSEKQLNTATVSKIEAKNKDSDKPGCTMM
jgi:hypothetical protein